MNIEEKQDIRNSNPQENIGKLKQVLLYILEKVGAKPNVGKTVLFKLLYFIDCDYYELYEEQLMGLRYVKKQFGPFPLIFDETIKEMKEMGQLEEIDIPYYDKKQTRYFPLVSSDPDMLTAQEVNHIDEVLKKHSDKTAVEISDFSHKDIPWISTKEGETLDYEGVFYRNESTSVRTYPDEI
ncbi:MAG: SocA family protein [Holosporales bacterium]|jgi:uncharacterized phage-associated protein|nr:SocA family protein [Holosporales bacterium]